MTKELGHESCTDEGGGIVFLPDEASSMVRMAVIAAVATLQIGLTAAHAEDTRESIAAVSGRVVQRLDAVGVQLYDCKADGRGGLAWMFREPVATLMREGKPVGRHFAGPSWEMFDGSLIKGKETGEAPGNSANDISWLRLAVSERKGSGIFKDVTTVQRIATVGGKKLGSCFPDGTVGAEPYAAKYVFSAP